MVVATAGGEQGATHAEMESLIRLSFSRLQGMNLSAGENVVFCCENRLEFSATLLACWALRANAILIDYRTEPKELFAVCEKLEAKLLFTSMSVTNLNIGGFTGPQMPSKMTFRVLRVDELSNLKAKDPVSQIDFKNLDMDGPALALFTSGTTGTPKTAVHNLRSLVQNIIDLAEAVDVEEGLTALTPLPVSHVFGLTVLFVTQVLGLKTVLTDLNPVTFIKAVHNHKPQLIAALPQFYGALLSAPKGIIDLKDANLLLTGGAPLTVSLADKFEKAFGKRLNNGYGSTESKIFALNKDGPVLSVGKALSPVEIEIIDSNGRVLPDGFFGEVIVTSPTLMDGYLNNEDKTKSVLDNGKYYTGDFGRLENGYLYIAGRKDDIITVAGVVVHAAEVEEALRSYSQVKEVAVTAVPNKWLGELVKANIVLMDDNLASGLKSSREAERRATKQALVHQFKAYCAEHLSRYKRPMLWHFLGPHDDLPKTLAGKVNKKELENR